MTGTARGWRAAAVAVLAAALLGLPHFGLGAYALHLMTLSGIAGIAALGLNVTNGYLGVLNLAPGAFVGLGAYASAVLSLAGWPVPVSISAALAMAAVVAVVVALAFLRMRGFFFALATLAVGEVVALLALNLEDVTRGPLGLPGIPRPAVATSSEAYYYLVVGASAGATALVALVARSDLGLYFTAIRENEKKAAALGLPVYQFKVAGFTIAAVLMALSGALLAHYLEYIDPYVASLRTTTETVLMVVLGGRGTVMGPLVGALAITLVPELLRAAPAARLILYGAALVATIMLLPEGVVPGLRRVIGRGRTAPATDHR